MRSTLNVFAVAAVCGIALEQCLAEEQEPVWNLPAGRPCATIDLTTSEGVELVRGQWRYSDAQIIETHFRSVGPDRKPSGPPNRTYDVVPKAGAQNFDDRAWEVLNPTTLDERRSSGKVCFNWYRINVTIPERIGDFRTAGSTVVFEIVVDDYAEVWVDGQLPRELRQDPTGSPGEIGVSGGPMVAGWNVPNRLVVGRDVEPGRQIQLAVFGMNGPISDAPANYIWVRSAKLEFFRHPCAISEPPTQVGGRTTDGAARPTIVRIDPALDRLIAPDTAVEKIADGFTWLEGPVWNRKDGSLLFSDIPANSIYRWYEPEGATLFLRPSGYSGADVFNGREPGSNGLTFDPAGRLIICQHGDRRIARLDEDGNLLGLIDRYKGKRLNSPNDAVFASNGDLYFTDPPFGLPEWFLDRRKELPYSGVFRLSASGELTLVTSELTSPNGIALSPDERTLYVSNADAENPVWMKYDLHPDGSVGSGQVFYSAAGWTDDLPGLPDGIKVDKYGNLFTAGPGGVYVFTSNGLHLGVIRLGSATSNCAWGGDGSDLYITAGPELLRVKTSTRGAGY